MTRGGCGLSFCPWSSLPPLGCPLVASNIGVTSLPTGGLDMLPSTATLLFPWRLSHKCSFRMWPWGEKKRAQEGARPEPLHKSDLSLTASVTAAQFLGEHGRGGNPFAFQTILTSPVVQSDFEVCCSLGLTTLYLLGLWLINSSNYAKLGVFHFLWDPCWLKSHIDNGIQIPSTTVILCSLHPNPQSTSELGLMQWSPYVQGERLWHSLWLRNCPESQMLCMQRLSVCTLPIMTSDLRIGPI